MIRVKRKKPSRISQGDIYRDVEHIEYVSEKSGVVEISKVIFPLVIVLTQDCDLEQEHRVRWSKNKKPSSHDKWLISVLIAPLYNAEHVYQGEHLSDLEMVMQKINKGKTQGKNLRNNETPRYHYLEFPENVPIVASVIDFKHYFSVNVKYLRAIKTNNFVCSVSELFREDISHRFSSYLARIGLPEISRP